jgi:hypothetical protein
VSTKRRKTVLRTVRLSKEIDDVLQEDAEKSGITASSLVNRIMKKYVEWDRYIEKFKFVSLAAETFQTLLEKVDEETLGNVIHTLGGNLPDAITLYLFKKVNLDTILGMISLYGDYSGLFTVTIDREERRNMVTLHHCLGKKWSTTIGLFLSQFIENRLGVVPEVTTTNSTAVLTFNVGSQDTQM